MLHARTCLLCFAETFLPAAPIFCSALPFTFRLLKNLSMVAGARGGVDGGGAVLAAGVASLEWS